MFAFKNSNFCCLFVVEGPAVYTSQYRLKNVRFFDGSWLDYLKRDALFCASLKIFSIILT